MTRWNLSGKKALVTGATKGIGRAIALELAGLGAEVYAVARGSADLQALEREAKERQLSVRGFAADVSRAEGRQALVQHVTQAASGLDLLINNVGTNIRRRATDYTEAEISAIFDTNLLSAFALCRALYPTLQAAAQAGRRPALVNLSSVAGHIALRSGAPYGMTKAALIQLTRNLACEWAGDGIRVNAVAPWYIATPLAQPVLNDPASLAAILARTPLKRIGTPEEVAGAVAFLCMEAASYVTGQCLAVDGGFLAFGF